MRRVFLLCVLSVIGCESTSRAPKFASRENDGTSGDTAPTPEVTAPKPDKSDPAAEQLVGDLLLKHTASEPARLDQLKTYISRRKGVLSTGTDQLGMEMVVHAVWPDRQRAEFRIDTPGGRLYRVFGRRQEGIWNAQYANVKDAVPERIVADKYEEARSDLWAEWITMLIPLAGSDRVVGPAPADADGSQTVRVWSSDRHPVLLSIDPKAGLLSRVRYEVRTAGRSVVRTLSLSEYKPVAGVQLPHRMAYSEGPSVGTLYKSVEYELPEGIDPAVFEKP